MSYEGNPQQAVGDRPELGIELDYFGARYYHPRLKFFTTPDPLWNKTPGWGPYVYTLNVVLPI